MKLASEANVGPPIIGKFEVGKKRAVDWRDYD